MKTELSRAYAKQGSDRSYIETRRSIVPSKHARQKPMSQLYITTTRAKGGGATLRSRFVISVHPSRSTAVSLEHGSGGATGPTTEIIWGWRWIPQR